MKWDPSLEIQFLKGVGPAFAEILKKKGIYTFKDLIEYYPRTYQDLSFNKKISELEEGENASLKLKYIDSKKIRIGKMKSITSLVFSDGSEVLEAKFFKSPYKGYFNQFEPQCMVQVSGKVKSYRGQFEMAHPDITFIKDDPVAETDLQASSSSKEDITPVYPESERLNQKKIRTLIDTAFSLIIEESKTTPKSENHWLYDPVPLKIKEKYKLMDHFEAVKQLHYPSLDFDSLKNFADGRTRAHLTLVFEEFFTFELLTAIRKKDFKRQPGVPVTADTESFVKEFLKTAVPFKLTKDQGVTLKEIIDDIKKTSPMHRLVQGDVGSGKTLVALASAYAVIKSGFQATIMAPTEILAEQHLKNAKKFFKDLGIETVCLTGKLKTSEKKILKEHIASGEAKLVVGTHALFEDDVVFKNLNLVIVDEQHRFGVHQRQRLKSKGGHPHFLVMTATPIPRTLTMTLYGDLDLSFIKTMPPGRTPVRTKKFNQKDRQTVIEKVKDELHLGHQAYFVFPLVSESEALDLKSAEYEYESLIEELKPYNVGLLHGKMKPSEKEEIMTDFRDNKIQALVSTTVIEVGVDVPNATVMVIENCERFGLSQLHQLRGRVGRGSGKSSCYLLLGNKFSKEGFYRACIMEKTSDGFEISEEDLKLRGPGEVLGVRQSGLPAFKLADLMKHQKVLAAARASAFDFAKDTTSEAYIREFKKKNSKKLLLGEVS